MNEDRSPWWDVAIAAIPAAASVLVALINKGTNSDEEREADSDHDCDADSFAAYADRMRTARND